jgi:hypothetical protein
MELLLAPRLWQFWGLTLVAVITVASMFSTMITTRTVAKRPWISVAPLFAAGIGSIATLLMLLQLPDVAAIISRLAQFSGAADALARGHAAAFVAMVVALTARALFVILEMDNGRYAGGEDLPAAVAQSQVLGLSEAGLRLIIIATLTLFAGAFIRVVIPINGAEVSIAGTAVVLSDLHQACATQREMLSSIGHGLEIKTCVSDSVAQLSEADLARRADQLVKPMPLLAIAYGAMLIWCLIVWQWALHRCTAKDLLRRSLLNQSTIPILAGLNLSIMLAWVDISTSLRLPFMQRASPDAISGSLIILSIFGVILTLMVFLVLTMRLTTDLRSLYGISRQVIARFHSPPQIESAH